ncbi:MAG: calcium/sodium antiporter [Bacteroidaceae bacterium]|nr:calcium/sodium antiporter [Bacteroidaceae bacterium]
MILTILLFVAGLAIILYGANLLTDGASALARRFNISELVIGLTIVALGTSLPEFVISLGAALQGSSGISLGNVVGSNIFNGLLILGVTALIFPVKFSEKMLSREIPFNLLAAIVLTLLAGSMIYAGSGEGEYITRNGGMILLCFLAIFIRYTFSIAKGDSTDEESGPQMSTLKITLSIIGGLAGLILGGKLFVNSATEIATAAGLSEAIIGITIVSAGSSLPELAVSVNAARKKNVGIALGNVLGSNILNIFLILGCTATICPIELSQFNYVDFYTLIGSAILIYIVGKFGGKATITRAEGALLVCCYIAYTIYLIMNQ